MTLADFVAEHPPQNPRIPAHDPDQNRMLNAFEGVFTLIAPPIDGAVLGRRGTAAGKYLWVIGPTELPAVLETAPLAIPPLVSGLAKHTNLTGGGAACCGGELWVDTVRTDALHLNGGSGRYPPRSPQELDDVVRVLGANGFHVESAGWDYDTDLPARVFR